MGRVMSNKLSVRAVLWTLVLCATLVSGISIAGFNEGVAALDREDFASALREFRPLALKGDADAQNNLGVMYELGQGVTQDYREAMKWYRLAANQGYAGAQNNLGVMYDKGRGVALHYREAVKWYRLAAEQGNASAQHNLGVMYDNGRGVAQDYREAAKWYHLAADQGDPDAQNNLGDMYKDGQGVPPNAIIAYALFSLAAAGDPANGNKATESRTKLATSMSVREIKAAQDLARELAKPGNLLQTLDKFTRKAPSKK